MSDPAKKATAPTKAPIGLNLRLYEPGVGWKAYADKLDDDGKIADRGSKAKFDSILLNGLNSTNLVVLSGSGTSIGIKNEKGKAAPSMTDLWDAVIAVAKAEFWEKIKKIVPQSDGLEKSKDIEKLLSQCKMFLELHEGETSDDLSAVNLFVEVAQNTILDRADFIDAHSDLSPHKQLLRRLARRATRKPRARIFTTNYDLCFEEAAQQLGLTQIDGFSHSLPQRYDRSHFQNDLVRREQGKEVAEYVEGVFHLYKIHGSIDWRRRGSVVFRDRANGTPVLIYPRNSKYQESFETPYLDMMSAFQASLQEPDTTLVVTGFGFNDNHIGQPILSALETNMTLKLVLASPSLADKSDDHIVNHSASKNAKNGFIGAICRAAEQDFGRITLVATNFENLSLAIPDIVAETERQRFAERSKLLRNISDKDGDDKGTA